jgi:transposase-like protein
VFQGAGHQLCRVHFARNLLALVPRSHQDMVAAVFRTIFAQPDPDTVAATWDQVDDQRAARFPKIATLMGLGRAEVLAFTAFPKAHWAKIWSTNPLERINKEIPVFDWWMPEGPRRRCLRSVTVPRSDSKEISTPSASWPLSSV